MRGTLKTLGFALAVAGFGGTAYSQDSFVVPDGTAFIDAAGDSDNAILSFAAATNYSLGPSVSFSDATFTEIATATWVDDARIRFRNSSHPGLFADLKLSSVFGYTGTFSLPAGSANLTGPLVGQVITAGSTWTLEFYEAFQDGPANVAEQTVAGLTLTTSVGAPPTPPAGAVDLGTLSLGTLPVQTSTHAAGETKWYKFTLSQPVTAANLRFLDIDTETSVTPFSDTEIALYSSTGAVITEDDDDGSGLLSQISFGAGAAPRPPVGTGVAYNGRDGDLAAGTYYLAVVGYNASFVFGYSVTTDSTAVGDINMNLTLGAGTPPTPPAVFTDLGTLVDPSTTVNSQNYAAGEIRWYRFVLPISTGASPNTNYFDIDTLGTANFGNNDTEIALFSNTGSLIASDDDSSADLLSQLTFGTGAGDRTDQGVGGGSLPYDGGSGDLAAGTYWLAVGGFNATFSSGWTASTSETDTGDITVNFRLNAPVVVGGLSGTVTLSDSDADWSNEDVQVWVYNGSTLVGSAVVALDAAGAYTASIVGMGDGTYDVYMKGDTFLRKLTSGVTVTSGAGTCDVTLINGDVNGDDEVGAADFSALAAAYDAVVDDPNWDPAADLNDDLEVGAADFSILAASYDATGDPLP